MNLAYDNVDFKNLDDWRTKKQIVEEFPQFKLGQLEWMLMPDKRKASGLEKVVRLIGRTLYIHRKAFSIWIAASADWYQDKVLNTEHGKGEVA